jgi:acetyl/propionyl-CoA carboxylase alpha subunit
VKIRVSADGRDYLLDIAREANYQLTGAMRVSGTASVVPVMPGVYSVIDGTRSFVVRINDTSEGFEAWIDGHRFSLRISDPRDRTGAAKDASAAGPQEVRALMPGKVVKLLVCKGDEVAAGSGLIVVEAMKMQNEMKAAKNGRVTRIHVNEGSTVAPGETLLVVE